MIENKSLEYILHTQQMGHLYRLAVVDCYDCDVLQDMWAETGLDDEWHEPLHVDSGSGTETSGECDDEDGCEGSGEHEEETGAFQFHR